MNIRLLLVDREFPPNPHGGIGSYNLAMARTFARLGAFVVLLSCTSGKHVEVDQQHGIIVVRVPHVHPCPKLGSYLRWLDQIALGRKLAGWAARLIQHYNLQLVELPSAGGYGLPIALKTGLSVPMVTRFHGALGRAPISAEARQALAQELAVLGQSAAKRRAALLLNEPLWLMERTLLQHSQAITFPSAFSQRWLGERISSFPRCAVIPNGIELGSIKEANGHRGRANTGGPQVVFVGRVSLSKGGSVLARALPAILSHRRRPQVTLVGPLSDPHVEQRLLQVAQQFPDQLEFSGRLSHTDTLTCVQRSSLLIHPTFYETSSMVILEAMACGVPAAASNTGPMPEIVTEGVTGRLFTVGDASDLAQVVGGMLDMPESRRRAMGRASMARVKERFDIAQRALDLLAFYREVVACGR